jgi:hypothetical protein
MNWLKICDTLILFFVRHLFRLQVGDVVILVYLYSFVEVLQKNWKILRKRAMRKFQTLN